jgi:hypothetical protein
LLSAAISIEARLRAETPKVLFEGKYEGGYDVMPDGRRFIMVTRDDDQTTSQLVVVQEWAQSLNHHDR